MRRGRFVTDRTPGGQKLGLSDFQRATAQHAFQRLYRDQDSSRRFLVADETGLGKTHVAQEVIAQTLKHLEQVDHVRRMDIVYVCSNADIARAEYSQAGRHRLTKPQLCHAAEPA